MFGEAEAIDSLRVDLIRTIRGSSSLASSTTNKLREDVIFAIMDSAITRDENLRLLTSSINGLNATLRRLFQPPDPGPLQIVVTGDSDMASMLGFKILLPELPPEPNDIVNGELTVQIGEATPSIIATAKEQTEITGMSGEQGVMVNVSFVYVDDAGNRSEEASTISIILVDTIPPATPGALGLTVTSESTGGVSPSAPPVPEPPASPSMGPV